MKKATRDGRFFCCTFFGAHDTYFNAGSAGKGYR